MKRFVAALLLTFALVSQIGAERWLWTETVELRFQSAQPVTGEVVEGDWDVRVSVVVGTVDGERALMSPGQTLRTAVNPARLLECVTHVFRADLYEQLYTGPPDNAEHAIEWRPPMIEYDLGSTSFTVDVTTLDRGYPRRIAVPVSVPVRHRAGPPTLWEIVFVVTVT